MKKNGKHLFIREIEYIYLWIRLGRVHQNWIKHILKQCLFKQIMVSIFIQKKRKIQQNINKEINNNIYYYKAKLW